MKLKYFFLTEQFYKDYKECSEIEKKQDRPYIQVCVKINNNFFAVPLRSHITHKFVLWTNKEKHCGLDFSKSVLLLKPNEYIDTSRRPYIRQEEFEVLKNITEYNMQQKLLKYIKAYKKAKEKLDKKENISLCNYSTLQYFEKYI